MRKMTLSPHEVEIDPMFGATILFYAMQAAATVSAQPVNAAVAEPDVAHMTPHDIKLFNAQLTRDHPYYIRCQTFDETGSLVKKTRVCKTNRDWRRYDELGNENARSTYEAMRSKGTTGN